MIKKITLPYNILYLYAPPPPHTHTLILKYVTPFPIEKSCGICIEKY
jgi:hypothetical protein